MIKSWNSENVEIALRDVSNPSLYCTAHRPQGGLSSLLILYICRQLDPSSVHLTPNPSLTLSYPQYSYISI
jgi:hypothetical protein